VIRKPIGAKLPSCELPGASFVNTEVIEGSDGMPDLMMSPSLPGELEGDGGLIISINDLRAIFNWATSP